MKKFVGFTSVLSSIILSLSVSLAPSATAVQLASPEPVTVGLLPLDIGFSANGKLAFVSNRYGGSVSVINTKTKAVIDTITVGDQPVAVERSKNNKVMYVTNSDDGTVSVIDIKRRVVTATRNVALGTANCRLNPKGTLLVCPKETIPYQLNIYKASNGSFVKSIVIPDVTYDVDFSKNGKMAYITSYDNNLLYPINLVTGVVSTGISVGTSPTWPTPSPDRKKLYIPNSGDDTVSVFSMSTNSVIATVPMSAGCSPSHLAARRGGRYMYVTCFANGYVEAITIATDTVDSSERVQIEGGINIIKFNPAGNQAYVANPMTDEVWILKELG